MAAQQYLQYWEVILLAGHVLGWYVLRLLYVPASVYTGARFGCSNNLEMKPFSNTTRTSRLQCFPKMAVLLRYVSQKWRELQTSSVGFL